MGVGDELRTGGLRLVAEDAVGAGVAGDGSVQVIGTAGLLGLVALLAVEADAAEVAVEGARCEGVGDDGLRSPPPYVQLPPRMLRRPDDGLRRDLGLEDGAERLGLTRHVAADPAELRRVDRGQIHHADLYATLVVQQLRPQRVVKALHGVLGRTVRRLQRNAAIRERR